MNVEPSQRSRAALARFEDLFVVLEDLIKRVADTDDPQIRQKRAAVRAQLIDLEKDASPIYRCVEGAHRGERRAVPQAAAPGDDWSEPVIAALTGAAVALTFFE